MANIKNEFESMLNRRSSIGNIKEPWWSRNYGDILESIESLARSSSREKERKNVGRQKIMSALAVDVGRTYDNKELAERKAKYQEYYNKYSSQMDEQTLELGNLQLDSFDRQIEKNKSFEQFSDQLESHLEPISSYVSSEDFIVGKEYKDEDIDKFREIVQNFTDYSEKFVQMHGDRLQLIQNQHIHKQLAHGAYINDFIVDSFFDDKKIDEVERNAYKQSITSNSIKPIQDYITRDDELKRTATKNLVNRIDASATQYELYNDIISNKSPVPNQLLPDVYHEKDVVYFDSLSEPMQESIRYQQMDLEKQIKLDDKTQKDRAGTSYIDYQFPNLFKNVSPPPPPGGDKQVGGDKQAGGEKQDDKYSSYIDSFSGEGDTPKRGMKLVEDMKSLDMIKTFGNPSFANFPKDQKKIYLNLVEERNKLEGTVREPGEYTAAEKGEAPIRMAGKRRNKIKSLKKELTKINKKRNSLKSRADQFLNYINK